MKTGYYQRFLKFRTSLRSQTGRPTEFRSEYLPLHLPGLCQNTWVFPYKAIGFNLPFATIADIYFSFGFIQRIKE
jgi:hypothetical protein